MVSTKEVEYEGTCSRGRVRYARIGHDCYFSGLVREVTTTINAADSVIVAIAREEEVDPRSLTYFDLQTHRGYDKPEGIFAFDRLELTPEGCLRVVAWAKTDCPANIRELFADLIGESFDL